MNSSYPILKSQLGYIKCSQHLTNLGAYLHISKETNLPFICSECINNSNILKANCTEISQILEYNSSNQPLTLPSALMNQDVQDSYNNLAEKEKEFIEQVNKYFQELWNGIEKAFNKVLDDQKKIVSQIMEEFKNAKQLNSIECLKNILVQYQTSNEYQLKNCINQICEENSKKKREEQKKKYQQIKQMANQYLINFQSQMQTIIQSLKSFNPKISINPQNLGIEDIQLIGISDNEDELQTSNTKEDAINYPQQMGILAPHSHKMSKTNFYPGKQQKRKLATSMLKKSEEFQNSQKLMIGISTEGEELTITKEDQDFIIYRQCYLVESLNPQSKYIINIELNNSYDNYPYFIFGLIDQSKSNTNGVWEEGIYYSQFDGGFVTKVVEGKTIHSQDDQQIGKMQLKFEIEINKLMFCVSKFNNKVELVEKNNIIPTKEYLFAIAICNPSDSVKILDVTEILSLNISG